MHHYLSTRTRLIVSAWAISMFVAPAVFATKKVERVEIEKIEKKAEKKAEKPAYSSGSSSSVAVVPELDGAHWAAAAVLVGGGFLLLAARRRSHQAQG